MKIQRNALAAILAGMLALGATACADDAADPADPGADPVDPIGTGTDMMDPTPTG